MVLYREKDTFQNEASCNFTVSVLDDEPPLISCPENLSVPTDPSSDRATVTYYASAKDNVGVEYFNVSVEANKSVFYRDNKTFVIVSNRVLGLGSEEVSYYATDEAGNVNTCSFRVTVEDTEGPAVICPNDIRIGTDAGVETAVVFYTNPPQSMDNVGVVNTSISALSGSVFPLHDTVVEYTAFDKAGNKAMCKFKVTIYDDEKPWLSCPDDLNISTAVGFPVAKNVSFYAVSRDNVKVTHLASTFQSGDDFPLQTTTVNFSATDDFGNVAQCTFSVTVVDTEAPTVVCPSNIRVGTDAGIDTATVAFPTMPNASDNVGVVRASTSRPSGSVFPLHNTVVEYTAHDGAGNEGRCNFTVTVVDDEPPILSCPSNITSYAQASHDFKASLVSFCGNAKDNVNMSSIASNVGKGAVGTKKYKTL